MAHSFFQTWRHPAKLAEPPSAEFDPADLGTELGLEASLGSRVAAPQRRAAVEATEAQESLGEQLESVFSHYGI